MEIPAYIFRKEGMVGIPLPCMPKYRGVVPTVGKNKGALLIDNLEVTSFWKVRREHLINHPIVKI